MNSFTKEPLHIDDVVVYLKNERTGSSTIRKCKFIGCITGFTNTKVKIMRLSNADQFVTPYECKNYGVVSVNPDDILHIIISRHSGFSRLSGDFNRGYTKAIQDIIEVFNYMDNDLKSHNMRMNNNWVDKILKFCLENREKLRENYNGFIRTEKSETGKRDIVKYYEHKE